MARKIQLNRAIRIGGLHHDIGQVVEVDDELAAQLIGANRAAEYSLPALASASDAPQMPLADAHPFEAGKRGRRNSR